MALGSRNNLQSIASNRSINISQLAELAGRWRIDWFGEVAFALQHLRYAQPSIRVFISCIEKSEAPKEQRSVWLPVGLLPALRIGDIWEGGNKVDSPLHTLGLFPELEISQNTTVLIKAGLPVDGHYLIPFEHHPWHSRATQSYCLMIKAQDEKQLLIPCLELIRFYFGSSSNLLDRLFKGPLHTNTLWKEFTFDSDSRHLHIKLASYLSGSSAPDIGRIALNPEAWRAASSIYSSCVKASAIGEPPYPHMGFPFSGKTGLQVVGQWLPLGDQPHSTFLVFRIESCSHNFPFASIAYETDWPQKIGSSKPTNKKEKDQHQQQRHIVKKSTDESIATTGDANSGRSTKNRSILGGLKFPDLKGKPIFQAKQELSNPSEICLIKKNGEVELLSLGEPISSSSSNQSVDISEHAPANLDDSDQLHVPQFVKRGMQIIRMDANRNHPLDLLPLKLQTLEGQHQPVIVLPKIVDEDGVILPISDWTAPDGKVRHRRACVVKDTENVKFLAILEGGKYEEAPIIFSLPHASMMSLLNYIINTDLTS